MITEEYLEDLEKIIKAARDSYLTSSWELEFIEDFDEKIEEHGLNLRISEKQMNVFERIETKLRKAGEL